MDDIKFTDCKIGKFEINSVAVAVDQNKMVYSWGDN